MQRLRPYIIVIAILLSPVWITFGMKGLGYYVNVPGWKVAQSLVKNNKSVMDCRKIIFMPWEIFSPDTSEQRMLCVHEYAELRKDPSACELLMPSSYGLDCVGGAEESLPCSGGSKPYSVYWQDGEKGNEESVRSCAAHPGGRSPLGNACCIVAQVAWLKDHNDCSAVKNMADVYDRCLAAMAWKKADPSYCEGMRDGNPKVACQVQTKALKEDPSICEGCTKALNDLSELKK